MHINAQLRRLFHGLLKDKAFMDPPFMTIFRWPIIHHITEPKSNTKDFLFSAGFL